MSKELSGKVAIISGDKVLEERDLGSILVETKDNVLPLETIIVGSPDAQVSETTYDVQTDKVVKTITYRDHNAIEIEEAKERELNRIDALIFKVLFDQENRIRTLENKAKITAVQYRAALKARL